MGRSSVDWALVDLALLNAIKADPDAKYHRYAKEVLDDTGIEVNTEHLRRHIRNLGLHNKPARRLYAGGMPLEEVTAHFAHLSEIEKTIEQEQEKRAASGDRREAKSLRRYLAERQDLVDELRDAFRHTPSLHIAPPPPSTSPHRPRVLILFLSDIHVGQLFRSLRGGGLGRYDLSQFELYAHRLAQKVSAITTDLRAGGPIDKLIIVFGGDMIDGRDIHPGHDHESESLVDQFRVGPEVLAHAVMAPLARLFSDIDVFAVPGNHGRTGRKGEYDIVGDSHDLVFMDFLKQHCRDIPHITWHPWETWFSYFRVFDFSYVAMHGDNFKAFAGIPFYGSARNRQRMESLLNAPIDVIMTAHHHSSATFGQGWGTNVMNGSWPGTSTFGSWLGLGGPPVQKMLLVSQDLAAGTIYDIYLGTREELLTIQPIDLTPNFRKDYDDLVKAA